MVALVRLATVNDCNLLGPRLRDADKEELKISCGLGPVTALTKSLNDSDAAYVAVDGEGVPILMFGVVKFTMLSFGVGNVNQDFIGVPWMLGGKGIYQHTRQLKSECKEWLDVVHKDYDLLFNYVHAENPKAIRWLQWMGFTMVRLVPEYGVGKKPFYEFIKVK
jgi:hypothetical protein|tara:strand:+ start:2839 stop:3330 length:492 start_codon:yes stop_codon:yes gene_type:complete